MISINLSFDILNILKINNIEFCIAKKENITNVMKVYNLRKQWFIDNKIKQWFNHKEEDIKETIKNGNLFCIKKDEEVIACFELSLNDKYFDDSNKDAYYVYKIVTHPNFKDVGKFIFNIIKDIAKNNNKKFIRLDCVKDNIKLNKIYESYGFKLVREDDKTYNKVLRECIINADKLD